MPWAPDYLELAEVKSALDIPEADETDDVELAGSIAAASRAIDAFTGRQFGQTDGVEVRTYPLTEAAAGDGRSVEIADLMATAGLVIDVDEADDGTFSTPYVLDTAARLWPWNAPAEGRPWTALYAVGSRRFPRRARAVRVTAQWGWAEIPAAVRQACLIQSIRLFKRKDSPFGVLGSPELGGEPVRLLARLDPDVELMLTGLRRRWYIA